MLLLVVDDSLAGHTAVVGGAVTRPNTTPESCVKVSLQTALRHTSLCHKHSIAVIAHPRQHNIPGITLGLGPLGHPSRLQPTAG